MIEKSTLTHNTSLPDSLNHDRTHFMPHIDCKDHVNLTKLLPPPTLFTCENYFETPT